MKMIDILVKELPGLGGWPCGASFAFNDRGQVAWRYFGCGKMVSITGGGLSFYANERVTQEQYESALAATKEPTVKQWKYIKGSEKDFVGAPEWATMKTFTGGCAFFAESHDIGASILDIARKSIFNVEAPEDGEFDSSGIEIIAQREPITAWDGVSLPPVGCEVEFSWMSEPWLKGIVKYISEHTVVMEANFPDGDTSDTEGAYCPHAMKFRPIRSEADKKRDASVGEMERGWEDVTKVPAVKFEVIYDLIAAGKIPGIKIED